MSTENKTDLTKVELAAWETPTLVRMDAADAEDEVAPAGEGASGMGMTTS